MLCNLLISVIVPTNSSNFFHFYIYRWNCSSAKYIMTYFRLYNYQLLILLTLIQELHNEGRTVMLLIFTYIIYRISQYVALVYIPPPWLLSKEYTSVPNLPRSKGICFCNVKVWIIFVLKTRRLLHIHCSNSYIYFDFILRYNTDKTFITRSRAKCFHWICIKTVT